ncbi:hypothetical protein [Pacificibacter marinus]|uniref:hypothetical protein n=1 Tax=Pacificibacter marinus TaxID=658057 RepID=UPI001C06EEF6|nr:hypothetical protein [Pacificibacter marinus]MBU2867076.1 hypothetical protein [Pacificibacter marinus]
MNFERISRENGKWDALWKEWDLACSEYDESISEYATSSLSILHPLANDPQVASAGVFGLFQDDQILATCQLNVCGLPGYTGKVIRLRHLVLAPKFDFDESSTIEDYVQVLTEVFAGTIAQANSTMKAKHAKLHFRSPADKQFFSDIELSLKKSSAFSSVALKGSWLYVSL